MTRLDDMQARLHGFLHRALAWLLALAGMAAGVANAATHTITPNTGVTQVCNAGNTAFNEFSIPVSGEANTVADLDFRLKVSHNYRRDLRIWLVSPAAGNPETVIYNGEVSNNQLVDYNNIVSDGAAIQFNQAGHGTNNAQQAAYQETLAPAESLNANLNPGTFDPDGTWRVRMCSIYTPPEPSNVRRLELVFTGPEPDLALSLTSANQNVGANSTVFLNTTVANGGTLPASGVSVDLNLPAGMAYQYHSGPGSYNPGTGVWTVGTLAQGASDTLQVAVIVSSTSTATAEVATQSPGETDSTAGNGINAEDDSDTLTLTVSTATPPSFVCSVGGSPFQLDFASTPYLPIPPGNSGWAAGNLSYSVNDAPADNYLVTVGGGRTTPLSISLTGDTNRLINRTLDGTSTPTPVSHPQMTGGGGGETTGVIVNVDFTDYSESVTMTMLLGTSGIGVERVQFPIYDVDKREWTDVIAAQGFLGATAVAPIYTTSTANTVVGATVEGTNSSGNTSAAGNMWVTFNQNVDRVVFTYRNRRDVIPPGNTNAGSQQPANPASQVISLEDILFCEGAEPQLSASKVVDTVPAGAFMVPGQTVRYTIAVANAAAATGDADSITINDVLPDHVLFKSASVTGFTGGAFGNPALPAVDDDCNGGACVINFEGGTLSPGGSGQVVIDAEIK